MKKQAKKSTATSSDILPNILMIITDQHRADWLGCTGHSIVKTPNIDALAARGSIFSNFNVATPVCMPNRGSILTGRYPSVHGLRHNGLPLPQSETTFVEVLRDAGYSTALIGKSHVQPMTNNAPRTGNAPRVNASFPEAKKNDGARYDLEEPQNFDAPGRFDIPLPFYGFDHVDLVTGHGDGCTGHYLQWLREQRNDWRDLRDRDNQLPHDYTCPQAIRTPIPEHLYPTAFIRDHAIDYLAKPSDAPRFTFVSFPDPHHPFTPPGKYWDMYSPDDFGVEVPFSAHRNPPPHLLACRQIMLEGKRNDSEQSSFMASDDEIRQARALTAGMITMIDDAVGEIIATVEASGELDNTIVIFTSDHGDYLGDLNMLLKGPNSRQSINRVPFIWVDPTGKTTHQPEIPACRNDLASAIDIAPTILAAAGCDPYHGIQGHDLFGGNVRQSLVIEHEDNKPTPGFIQRANLRTMITDTHRITVYRGIDWGEMYDLVTDPDELNNLWDDAGSAGMKTDLLHRLSQHLVEAVDPSPWPKRLA